MQVDRLAGVAFHCARRERVLLRDILRLGTATVSSLSSRAPQARRVKPTTGDRQLHENDQGFRLAGPHIAGTGLGILPDTAA